MHYNNMRSNIIKETTGDKVLPIWNAECKKIEEHTITALTVRSTISVRDYHD